jgi:hypothetical protein
LPENFRSEPFVRHGRNLSPFVEMIPEGIWIQWYQILPEETAHSFPWLNSGFHVNSHLFFLFFQGKEEIGLFDETKDNRK